MLKRILLGCAVFGLAFSLFAGDVAVFVDEGFSSDGTIYVFGQYGSVDKTWQGYAQIYTVDIAENDYVDGGVFSTPASSATQGKNGHTLYTDLRKKNTRYLDDLQLKTIDINNTLYIRNTSKSPTETISITDFEATSGAIAPSYTISLTPWFSGNTPSSQSSFFITVEKRDENGNSLGKQVIGNPDIKRKGVIAYNIEKILKSPDGNSFIFIIEKTHATENGNSIRYMVETLEVSNFSK